MKKARGLGSVFQPRYKNHSSGETKTSAVWWIRYHYRGKLYRESSKSENRADAVRLLKHRLGGMGRGRLIGPDAEKTTFEDLSTILQNDYAANGRKSAKRVKLSLDHLRCFFGGFRAIDITADRITAYIARRQEQGAAAASINRELAALKRALSLAVAAGRMTQRPHFSLLREENARAGFFEQDQFAAMLGELPAYLKPLAQTAHTSPAGEYRPNC
jgi:hypothetical protein